MSDKTILITGATGHQGGAVLRHLAKQGGFKLRALTRKPDDEKARALTALGAEVVRGDFADADSIKSALDGVRGVFAVQNTWEGGVEKEEEDGKRVAKLARDAGVEHYVYTSVASAHRKTGIPHFENKFRIEETVRELGFPSHVIIRPVFFMENLLGPNFLQGDKLVTALDPQTKLQMIAVDDIGKFGALSFTKARELNRSEIDIAGDSVTMVEVAAEMSARFGKKIEYQRIPMDAVRQMSADFAAMLEWFESTGYNADIASLEPKYGIRPRTLKEWLREQAA
jgi:uncharacterized protein YbjT (DUF2867 family)